MALRSAWPRVRARADRRPVYGGYGTIGTPATGRERPVVRRPGGNFYGKRPIARGDGPGRKSLKNHGAPGASGSGAVPSRSGGARGARFIVSLGYHRLAPGAAPEVKPEARATGGARGATLPVESADPPGSTAANTSVVTVAVGVPFTSERSIGRARRTRRTDPGQVRPAAKPARPRVTALGVARAERGRPLLRRDHGRDGERYCRLRPLSLSLSLSCYIVRQGRIGDA